MDNNVERRLKRLRYKGFNPPYTSAEILYMVVGNEVIFTAAENSGSKTTTINAVEEIIALICETEELDWRDYMFYDMQTWIGYPHHGFGYYCIDKLVFAESANLHVTSWQKVASSTDQPNFLQGLPREIVKQLVNGA